MGTSRRSSPSTRAPGALERWQQAVVADLSLVQVVALDLLHVDGSIVPAEVSSVGMVGPDGRFAGITGATRDISERTRLLRELRESEERYRSSSSRRPISSGLPTARLTSFVSDSGHSSCSAISRTRCSVVTSANSSKATGPRTRRRRWSCCAASPAGPQTYTVGLRTADGHHKPFEVSTVALVEDGEIAALYGVARDISERQRLERELRESEERYRFLVQSSPDLIWTTDANGFVTFVSDAIRSILGWEPDEVIGRPFVDLAPKARRREAAPVDRPPSDPGGPDTATGDDQGWPGADVRGDRHRHGR